MWFNRTDEEWASTEFVAKLSPTDTFREGGGSRKLWHDHDLTLAPYLRQTIPNRAIREEADAALVAHALPSPTVGVHARRLDGQCVDRLRLGEVMCNNPAVMQGVGDPSLMVACGWNASVPIGPRAVVFSDNKFWTYAKTARGRWPPGANKGKIEWHPNGTSDAMYIKRNPGWVIDKQQFFVQARLSAQRIP